METITKKGTKNVSLMVRMPKNITNIIDSCVGNTHGSRPDFVIDGIRAFNRYICDCEYEILEYLKDREDADRNVQIEFYRETIRSRTQAYRDEIRLADKTERDVDILLSLPNKLAIEIDLTVDRTGCFRNRQEFIKSAVVYLSVRMKNTGSNIVQVIDFLKESRSTENLQEQVEKMRKEMTRR